jgi:hypothetical protein
MEAPMSDEKSADIDPRFDPAFQRGFDPSVPVEEYVPQALPRRITMPPPGVQAESGASSASAFAPKATPETVRPLATTVVAAHPDAPPIASSAGAPTGAPTGDAVDEPEMEPDANAGRNPFLLFLGIIAIALIAAGIWLFVSAGDSFNSKAVRSQGDYMSLTATIQTAPFIALLGAATAIGVLFVFASRWRRRR